MSSLTCGCGHARAQHAYLGDGAYGVYWKSGCYCPGCEREQPLHLRDVSAPSAATEIAKPAADPSAGTPTPGAAVSEPKSPVVADEAAAGAATCNHEKAGALPTEPPARPTQGGSTRMSTTETTTTTGERAESDPRAAFIQGLRELADFFEQFPDLRFDFDQSATILAYCRDKDELAGWARAFGRADKRIDESWFNVERKFGPFQIQAYTYRDAVCERVVVGQETVRVEEPDPDALAAVPKITKTVTRDVIEWRCDEPLLAPDRAAAQDDPRGETDNGRELTPAETTSEKPW